MLSAGLTPHELTDQWSFTVTSETGESHSWSWQDILALPQDRPVVDIHCVTRWSKFDTRWQGVPLDHLIGAVDSTAGHIVAQSADGCTTNVPRADVTGGKAWLVHFSTAMRWHPTTEAPGCWSRTCTSGSQPNGSRGCA